MTIADEQIIAKVRANFKFIRSDQHPLMTPELRRYILRVHAWIYARRRFGWKIDYPKLEEKIYAQREEGPEEESHEGEGQVACQPEQSGPGEE